MRPSSPRASPASPMSGIRQTVTASPILGGAAAAAAGAGSTGSSGAGARNGVSVAQAPARAKETGRIARAALARGRRQERVILGLYGRAPRPGGREDLHCRLPATRGRKEACMNAARRCAVALVAVAALAGAAGAGDGKGDYAEELAKLRKEYDEAQAAYARDRPVQAGKNPNPLFLPKFLDLAARARGTDDGVRAAAFVVQKGANSGAEAKKAAEEALDLALKTGLKCRAIGEMSVWLRFGSWGLGEERVVAALRTIGEKAGAPDARAAGLFNLAVLWAGKADGDPGKGKEALALLRRVMEEHGTSSSAREAPGYVFELEHLQVGMEAPDFEAVDQDGVKFRLSGYRGRVVLLDFWGFW